MTLSAAVAARPESINHSMENLRESHSYQYNGCSHSALDDTRLVGYRK